MASSNMSWLLALVGNLTKLGPVPVVIELLVPVDVVISDVLAAAGATGGRLEV